MIEISVDEIFQINETKYKNRYQPLETLAKGSFGVVIKALDLSDNSEVAVKIIPKNNSNESSINQFKEEVKALTKINHSNIVKLYDFFETKDNMYFVMEYVKGGTLNEMMRRRNYLFSEDEARIIIENVLKAVEHLHKLNICHRDIKPDNIMFSDYNDISSIKIIDFGLSTQSCDNIQMFCGTFSFMAPERLMKLNYSEKSDIWSIGIITYMLLKNGNHPFYLNKETKESYPFKFQDYSTEDVLSSAGFSL